MDITAIPFVKHVGIRAGDDGQLCLASGEAVQNHLGTLHAGAQFALAESASGACLQALFPALSGRVVPVLRSSQVKFRAPARAAVTAFPTVSEEERAGFEAQFGRKGRATIAVEVEVRDGEGTVTCKGVFEWYVQAVEVRKSAGTDG